MKWGHASLATTAALLAAHAAHADATTAQQNGSAPTDVAAGVTTAKDPTAAAPKENKPSPDSTVIAVNAGAQFATGNSQMIAVTGGGKVDIRRGNNGFGAALVANYATNHTAAVPPATSGVWADTQRNIQGKLRYERFFTRELGGFIQVTGTHDAFQATTFRLNVDPGVSYLFVDKERTKLWGEVGYDFEFDDNYTDSQGFELTGTGDKALDATSALPILIVQTNTMHSSRAFVGLRHSFNKDVALGAGLEYLQGFGGSGDGLPVFPAGYDATTATRVALNLTRARLNFDALLTAHLAGAFTAGLGFTARYNSNPLPGKQSLDTTTTLTLIFALTRPDKDAEKKEPVCPTGVVLATPPVANTTTTPPPPPAATEYKKTLGALVAAIEDAKPAAETAPVELTDDQLMSLADLLKAYPNVAIKISAPAARADAIKTTLTTAGIDAKRVTTEAHDGAVTARLTAK